MTAGKKYEYRWVEQPGNKLQVSAPEYVDRLCRWINDMLNDDDIFPSCFTSPKKSDAPSSSPSPSSLSFPNNFKKYICHIFRRLYRVFAHIYHHHMEKIVSLGEEAYLNTWFRHFYYFIHEFDLVPEQETDPLKELIECFLEKECFPENIKG
uniref:Mob1/phocein family protein n=1 Tax=Paramoeba aestuarina TaxID=180227 RepID=A0A7S4L8B4_9EUKA|mmetsp:Transcript_33219/g.51930  ORF Transcript_33219/g.51930 Transcript_33219/m.51930 type:complete len:152 (+) Transcript_33219:431-886(+)